MPPVPSRPRAARCLASLSGLLLLAGACGATPGSDSVRRFSDTLAAVAAETREGFAVVGEVERRAVRENAALAYMQTGRATLRPEPVFTGAAAAALDPTFEALEAYAQALAGITSGSAAARTGAAAARAGAEVAEALARAGVLRVPPELARRGTAALDQLGQLVAEEIVRLSLPAVIDRAHPSIEAIAAMMTAVIGRPEGQGQLPEGLRGVLDERRRVLLRTRQTILAEVGRSGSLAERYALYQRLYEDERLEPGDQALAALSAAIGQMVAAHAALRSPDTAAAAVAGFENAARRLKAAWRELRPLLG